MIIIFGPTAVGKSSFAEQLAEHIPSQIVNCDIGQFYAPFSIGTAKPDWKNSKIKHNLFDIIDEPRHCNVCEYRKLLFKAAEKIWKTDELPILVGGSGFYLSSLFFPPISYEITSAVDSKTKDTICSINVWNMLYKIDPQRAVKINKQDTYRIRRALNIWEKTGRKPSEFRPIYDFPSNFLFLSLTRNRTQLYERIDERVLQMIDQGWITEVENLMGTDWQGFLSQKKLIGYDVIIDYLERGKKEDELEKVFEIIQKKTRNYAKRQIIFFKSLKKQLEREIKRKESKNKSSIISSQVESIDLTLLDCDLYIKKLLHRLNPLFG